MIRVNIITGLKIFIILKRVIEVKVNKDIINLFKIYSTLIKAVL